MTMDILTDSTLTESTPHAQTATPTALTMVNLVQLAIGFMGIQFALSSQIALSQQVLEPLGASPFLYGLVWCVGPLSGLLIQPILSSLYSNTPAANIRQRKLFILGYSLLGAVGMAYFPQAPSLLMAGLTLALLDVTLNTAQGGYRALIPDVIPSNQLPIAHSFINFAFALAPVIALSILPLLQALNYPITLMQQYFTASILLITLVFIGLQTLKDTTLATNTAPSHSQSKPLQKIVGGLLGGLSAFTRANAQIRKLCAVVFFVWMGVMCLFIYLTPFVVHQIYELPDMSQAAYKKEESLYQLAKQVDAKVATEADYKTLSAIVASVSKQKQQLLVPTVADVTALQAQLDKALTPYFKGNTEETFETIKQLSTDKELSAGISGTERMIELKLALLEFPLYEKTLDSQPESTATVEAEQAVGTFATLPLLETLDQQNFYADTNTQARSTAMIGLVIFNLIALLLTIPLALLAKNWGKKRVFTLTLLCMVISLGVAPWIDSANGLFYMMAGAGVAWATILSIPFALFNDHVTQGDERAMMGVLNLFISTPQLIIALGVGQWIEQSPVQTALGDTHNWSIAFIVASVMIFIGLMVLQTIKEKRV
jgi:MFS family permease